MKIYRNYLTSLIAVVIMFAALALCEPSKAQAQTSAGSSPTSVIPAKTDEQKIINACAATAIDLEKTRINEANLESENKALNERLDTERRTTALYAELNETRKGENRALSDTVAAKNETIAAKNQVIEKQDLLVNKLKKNKSSPIEKVGGILVGVALTLLLK